MAKWRCTVCTYTVEADEPPEVCPQCGAPKEKFERIEPEPAEEAKEPAAGAAPAEAPPAAPAAAAAGGVFHAMRRFMVSWRIHPISVHMPNGLLPASTILLFLGLVFSNQNLRSAAFYNLLLVVIAMPVVFLSGFGDWQSHYGGTFTRAIVIKIVCAVIVFFLGCVLVVWHVVAESTGWLFFLFQLIMLGAAGMAGHQGGKLVFGQKERGGAGTANP